MRIFSLIISWLYGLGVRVRNLLYDEHILYSHVVSVPTVCVGNLAVGGTGKTPHTEFVAKQLSKQFRVAILSRGYKRKTRGFMLADEYATALSIGDEPMQMHINLPDVVVAVCESRMQGIRRLMRLFPDIQVVVLDDAFQHRSLTCGFNILLTAADNLYVNDKFLPYGTLRDSRYSALRANMIVITKCQEEMRPIDRRVMSTSLRIPQYQQLFFSYLKYSDLQPLCKTNDTPKFSDFRRPILLAGIANTTHIENYLHTKYNEITTISFPDHHAYRQTDFNKIEKLMRQNDIDVIITTQKDAVRLLVANMPNTLISKTMVLPVEVSLRDAEADFMRPIIQYVTENNRISVTRQKQK